MTGSPLRALVFGEALIDRFPDRSVVAGAPLHVAVHLAARGWEVSLVSRVGRDPEGGEIRRVLAGRGVDTSLLETDPRLPTGMVTVEPDGTDHSFTIEHPAAWDAVEGPDRIPDHDALCYTGLAVRDTTARAALGRILPASTAPIRCLDLTFRPPHVHPEGIRLGMRGATVLKGNDDELDGLARLLGLEPAPEGCWAAAPDLRWVCITHGPKGASLWERGGDRWSIPGREVEVVDTVGAGDAFTAALVDGLARGLPPSETLEEARDASAAIAAQRGGLPS